MQSQVVGVDISPHMKPDDTPDNFWPQVRDTDVLEASYVRMLVAT